ncbi:MAG: hypothetical protein ACI4SF_00605 [Oscillospiraceae bacterium]
MNKVHIDTEKRIFTLNGEDLGDKCTCIEIKITPDDFPEVILHLIPEIEANVDNCEIQCINDAAIDTAADSNVPTVETSVN